MENILRCLTLLAALCVRSEFTPVLGESPVETKREEARYDGLTLAEWRERIKTLELNDPASLAAVPGLIAIAKDRNAIWFSRRQAAETLGRLSAISPQGVPVLMELLNEMPADSQPDSDPPAGIWSIKALALAGPAAKEAAPSLVQILANSDEPLSRRQLALEALAQIGPAHPAVLPAILDRLNANRTTPKTSVDAAEIELRELAVESFTLLGPRGAPAIPALLRSIRDPSDILRMKVAQAIGAMGGRGEIAVPALVESLLFDTSSLVRDAAADALGKIGGEGLSALIQLLEDPDVDVRWRAAQSIGTMGRAGRTAAERLEQRLSDESPVVRIFSAEALWKVTLQPEPALTAVVSGLRAEDRQLRIRAFRLLQSIGTRARSALARIEELRTDPNPAVREAARRASQHLRSL